MLVLTFSVSGWPLVPFVVNIVAVCVCVKERENCLGCPLLYRSPITV